ncbi:MAG: hypothetical protein AAGM38_17065 [Pseudomonadota bacterium]
MLRNTMLSALAAFAALSSSAAAEAHKLTLRFEINPVITGSRPWDGTGVNSAQIDGGEGGGFFGGFGLEQLGQLGQVGLDQFNQRIAPPDPYLCLVLTDEPKLKCNRAGAEKDTLQMSVALPADLINRAWFGVVLIDSDEGNLTGGVDDLIGYGVMLDEPTLAKVRAGDPEARRLARFAEKTVTEAVRKTVGTHRSLLGEAGGGRLDAAKLSASKCEYGCTMGEARITVSTTVDGW